MVKPYGDTVIVQFLLQQSITGTGTHAATHMHEQIPKVSVYSNGKDTLKFFFQGISWNAVSGWFHKTWKTFMKCFYFNTQHSLRTFFINKKIVFTEKRYRVKFNSIKKYLLLIKQKQKNSKIPKRIWMKPCSKTRSAKSGCANIFLELSLII